MADHVARLGQIVAMLEASDYPTRQHLARYRERLSKLKRQMETITMTNHRAVIARQDGDLGAMRKGWLRRVAAEVYRRDPSSPHVFVGVILSENRQRPQMCIYRGTAEGYARHYGYTWYRLTTYVYVNFSDTENRP